MPGTTGPSHLPSKRRVWKILGIGTALGVVATVAACGSNSTVSPTFVQAFAQIGQPNFNASQGNGCTGLAASGTGTGAGTGLNSPIGALATDGTTYYIADTNNNRILGWNTPAKTQPFLQTCTPPDFVLGQNDLTSTGSGASLSQLKFPTSVRIATNTATGTEQLVVADSGNNRVLIWSGSSLPSTTGLAANVVVGQTAAGNGSGNGGNAPAMPPTPVCQVTTTTTNATNNTSFTSNPTYSNCPNPLPPGNPPSTTTTSGSTTTTTTYVVTSTATALSSSVLNNPTDALINGNTLFVADQGNDRVLIWNTVPTTDGAPASLVLGQPDFLTDSFKCTGNYPGPYYGYCNPNTPSGTTIAFFYGFNQMVSPNGLWSDGHHLLIADTGNNRVLYYAGIPTVNYALANNVVGQGGQNRNTAANTSTGLRAPTGVGSGVGVNAGINSASAGFYVADTGNNRVLFYSQFPTSDGIAANAVYGQSDFIHNTADDSDQNNLTDLITAPNGAVVPYATQFTLSSPTAVSIFNNVVYITDQGNNRVIQFPGS